MVQPGKTEMRLKLQAEHRRNLREFDKRIVTELDEKVIIKMLIFERNQTSLNNLDVININPHKKIPGIIWYFGLKS